MANLASVWGTPATHTQPVCITKNEFIKQLEEKEREKKRNEDVAAKCKEQEENGEEKDTNEEAREMRVREKWKKKLTGKHKVKEKEAGIVDGTDTSASCVWCVCVCATNFKDDPTDS